MPMLTTSGPAPQGQEMAPADLPAFKQALRRTADRLSDRIYILQRIAVMASFAAEARRTLEGIDSATRRHPEMEEFIAEGLTAQNNWAMHEDVTVDVLDHMAGEIRAIQSDMEDALYALAAPVEPSPVAADKARAAEVQEAKAARSKKAVSMPV